MVGPDYKEPDAKKQVGELGSPDAADVQSAGITTSGPTIREWWTTLKDLKLETLIEEAVSENQDLKVAQARVKEARGLHGVAAGALYPQMTLGGANGNPSANVGPQGTGNRFHSSMSYTVGFDASWELDLWGGVRRNVESAQAGIDVAMENRRAALVTLLGEVGLNYVQLRGEQRELAIAKKNVDLQEKTLHLVEVELSAGIASKLDVAQQLVLLETTRATVPTFEQQIAQSIYALSVLCGKEPSSLVEELAEPSPIPEAPPVIPVGLASELLLRRPDIRVAEKSMHVACANIGAAEASLYPEFSLTGSIGYSPSVVGRVAGSPEFFAGPSVTWPIFNGFETVENIKVMDARLEEAVYSYRSAVLGALQDVEGSIIAYAKETVRRQVLTRAAKEAATAEHLAEVQFKSGVVAFLNVIQAETALASSEQSLVVSEQTLLTDLIAVYKALGGGWDVFEERLAEQEFKDADRELPK